MEDDRDFITQTQSRSVDYTGKELSPAEMSTEFAKWDITTRVAALQEMRQETGDLSIAEAARRYAFKSALRSTHEALRKVGR